MLVSNHMIKTSCFRSDRGSDRGKRPVSGVIEAVIEENLLYHCL